MINFVAAHDRKFGIGYRDKLPWPLMAEDKAHLHKLARGKKLVMGERTYRNYKNIRQVFDTNDVTVLSNNLNSLPDATVVHLLNEIVDRSYSEDLWVLGGGMVFKQLLPYVDVMYLTVIEAELEADTYFPAYSISDWKTLDRKSYPANDNNPYPYTFITLQKITKS